MSISSFYYVNNKINQKCSQEHISLRTGGCGPSFPCTSDLQRRVKCGKERPAEPALGQGTFMEEAAVIPPVRTSVCKGRQGRDAQGRGGRIQLQQFYPFLDQQVATVLEVKS